MVPWRLLLLLVMLLGVVMAGSSSGGFKAPFRGELSAVPRGLDVLLHNIAPRSRPPDDNHLHTTRPSTTAAGETDDRRLLTCLLAAPHNSTNCEHAQFSSFRYERAFDAVS